MLVEDLIDFIFNFLSLLFSDISLPKFEYFDYIYEFVNLIVLNGSTAANIFLPFEYILILFTFTLYAEGVVFLFGVVLWVLKKIPLLNIH